jgi:hypothetical protein
VHFIKWNFLESAIIHLLLVLPLIGQSFRQHVN